MSDITIDNRKDSSTVSAGGAFSILLMISVCHFLNDTLQSLIPAIYPILKENFSLTFAQIGIITFCFQMTSSILQPFVGRYADKHPKPFALALGMLFTLAGLSLLCVADSFYSILLSVCVIGCGSSIFHPEAARVARMSAGSKKGLGQSMFQVGGNSGTAAGPLLAALIIIPFGQFAIGYFDILAIFALLILIRVGFWYKNSLLVTAAAKTTFTRGHSLTSSQIRNAIILLLILMFSKNFFSSSMINYFTFFLISKFGISIYESQMCLFAFLAACAVGIMIGGIFSDRVGRKAVIWVSILGAAPFTLALPYIDSFALTVALAVLIGMIISSSFSAILVFATDLLPEHVGMIAGIFFGFAFGMGGIFSAFFGFLADHTSIEFVFQVSTLLPLMGFLTYFLPSVGKKQAVKA